MSVRGRTNCLAMMFVLLAGAACGPRSMPPNVTPPQMHGEAGASKPADAGAAAEVRTGSQRESRP